MADPVAATPLERFHGIVKQILDGGAVIIRGQPTNGPPPERTLALADIEAPRLARRPTLNAPTPTQDEPWAWESREFLRRLLVGKSVVGQVNYKIPATGREFGAIFLDSNDSDGNVALKLVTEGLVKLRDNCQDEALKAAQVTAQNAQNGMWNSNEPISEHIRNITWEVDDPRQLVDLYKGKPIPAVIENVRDGSTLRAFLLPQFHYVTLMLSGVRCPNIKPGPDGRPDPHASEPFAMEAQFFTESRLLQRDVEVILESVNNKNLVGSVIHPCGNIAEALLREGFAKCVDWSLACVSVGRENYRLMQNEAKEKKKRVWKDHTAVPNITSSKDKEFTAKVMEIVNGDAMVIKKGKESKKIHLASIRAPRLPENRTDRPKTGQFRPLYDIPFMFEAREFLRKKLIGQNVQVTVDYIQPANNDYPEKTCCTVTFGGMNMAEALLARGLATVVYYAADNDQRSSKYDDLLSAEAKAKKENKGVHNKKPGSATPQRIVDLSGDVSKSKQFLSSFQRADKIQGVVEFVASASRFRIYVPHDACVITFLLSGISCPRATRTMPGGQVIEEEPFGNEAMLFVKEQILQREVEIKVESMDKGGNFIGWCHHHHRGTNSNLSLILVENGFASSFHSDNYNYFSAILNAEEKAKKAKLRRWANYVEDEDSATKAQEEKEKLEANEERKVDHQKVVITEVTTNAQEAKFFAQHVTEGEKLEQLMKQIREEFSSNPPLGGAYRPKKGDLCAAKYVDGQWYRAKIEKVTPQAVAVLYIDYGNRANVKHVECASLPGAFTGLPAFAKEYRLALCQAAPDEDYALQGLNALRDEILDKSLELNVEYRSGGIPYVTLLDNDRDVGKNLISEGLMIVEKKGGRRLAKLVDSYLEAMDSAKKNHHNIWEYGDITADDAKEFGHSR